MSMSATTTRAPNLDVGSQSVSLVDVLNHELRTPLTVLLGHVELLQDLDVDLPEQAARSFAAIAGAVSRLAEVADTISRIADAQAVDATVVKLPADLDQTAQRPARARGDIGDVAARNRAHVSTSSIQGWLGGLRRGQRPATALTHL